jgi:hypothetical protein
LKALVATGKLMKVFQASVLALVHEYSVCHVLKHYNAHFNLLIF